MSTNADEAHRRAEALFKKEQQRREGQQAMAEYQTELRAMREKDCAVAGAPVGSRRRHSEDAARQPEGRGVIPETTPAGRQACTGRVLIGRVYAASVANSIGSTIEGLSFSGLLPCIRPHAHQPGEERSHQVPGFSRADDRTAHCSSLISHSRLAVSLSCAMPSPVSSHA
jgi:hypothetical protein